MQRRNAKDTTDKFDSLFELVAGAGNASIVEYSEAIDRQVTAIRRLEEVTRQVDLPYIGSYLSV